MIEGMFSKTSVLQIFSIYTNSRNARVFKFLPFEFVFKKLRFVTD